jgi:hypothetical protein
MSRRWPKSAVCIALLVVLLVAWNTAQFIVSLRHESDLSSSAAHRPRDTVILSKTDFRLSEHQTHPISIQESIADDGGGECLSHTPINGGPKNPMSLLQELASLGRSPDRSRITNDHHWQRELISNICSIQFSGENAYAVSAKAVAKAADALQWLRAEGILWNISKGCRKRSTLLQQPLPQRTTAMSPTTTWRGAIKQLPQVRPHLLEPHERQPNNFHESTFGRIPKKASWITATNMCASCEPPPGAYYMASRHSCYFTLWGVGDSAKLHKLTSTSRGGRNVIFKERISSYQYGGILSPKKFAALVDDKDRPFTSSWYVNGTTVWLGPYEFNNPGHVIHDALWTWQLALMLPDIYNTDPNRQKSPSPVYPAPIRAVLSHDFETLSSEYFGVLSWMIATGEAQRRNSTLNVERIERSPFPSTFDLKRPLVCFEKLVIPGQDRHVDGGGLGLRQVVAKRLRQHVFSALHKHEHTYGDRERKPRIGIYGRNDVYRRSIDNTDVLLEIVANVARRHHLPPPSTVGTFDVSPEEQFRLMESIDVFVAIQGSHLQNSLFMPDDGAIVELAPCRAEFVSFMRRYGKYLDSQSYTYLSLCDNVMINYSEKDAASQNVTLCPQVAGRINDAVERAVVALLRRRGLTG